ncbi:orphan sodium- and chloride-dependent neurotransmitter transporter NTT5 [Tupaia chinensis]|uniref:orphan sodium- and chloride-dependent neurotransmitter transporter NTT5 n=1 Tax=Tupaia chinensis TaxID=246437 RepID=UPI000FFCB9A1|nr:orphan sodium- and chloride-dependent neurotransmitter transporter NTT5 [Tupaia chinensis]
MGLLGVGSQQPGDLGERSVKLAHSDAWRPHTQGSFVIIYILMLFLIGIPLLFLEMAAGQRMRQSSIGLWKMFSPWIGGVGYTSVMVNFITGTYLNVVNAWVLFYMSQSFQFPVPWEKCPLLKNSSDFDPECARTTPFTFFWYRLTLKASDTIDDGGPPVLSLSLPFFVSWCLIGACMISGLKSIGKVMYTLVLLPHLIIPCYLIWSLQLEGAGYGLQHLASIKMSSLYSVNTWSLAGSQVLFNFGLGFGPIAALASHTAQSNNCLGDALIVALFSLVALLVILPFIFSILGFWATIITHRCCEKNAETILKLISAGKLPSEAQPPENLLENPTSIYNAWLNILPQHIRSAVLREVPECNKEKQFLKVKEGSSFAFLSFVEAMSFLPGSILWSVFFLLVLLTLEMSTMIGMVYTIITSVQDTFSSLRKHAKLLTDTFPLVGVCMLMFLCGIFFVQPSGIYFIILLSEYWTVIPIVVIIVLENIAVAWAYGARRLLADLILLNRPVSSIFDWLWCYVCPAVLLILFVAILVYLSMETFTYIAWDSSSSKEVLRQYPTWTLVLMIIIFVIVIFPIPVYFIYCLIHGIPFRPKSEDRVMVASKTQPLSDKLPPTNSVQKEEIPQGDRQNDDQPVI